MKIAFDGFEIEFSDAKHVLLFDQPDVRQPAFHGLSHTMKAVDLVVEFDTYYLFVEVKDFHDPSQCKDVAPPANLVDSLKDKFRDTFLYRWAEGRLDKPVKYVCLLTLDNALASRVGKELRCQLPHGKPVNRWQYEVANACVVVNVSRWNENFPKWPAVCLRERPRQDN
jgi:hypothetical protein